MDRPPQATGSSTHGVASHNDSPFGLVESNDYYRRSSPAQSGEVALRYFQKAKRQYLVQACVRGKSQCVVASVWILCCAVKVCRDRQRR